jgi:hypothetical protein
VLVQLPAYCPASAAFVSGVAADGAATLGSAIGTELQPEIDNTASEERNRRFIKGEEHDDVTARLTPQPEWHALSIR